MVEDDHGIWIRYDDLIAWLDKLRAALVATEQTIAAAAALEMAAHATGDAEIFIMPIIASAGDRQSSPDPQTVHPEINVRALAAAVAKGDAPATFLVPNMTALRQWAKATQGGQTLNGIWIRYDDLTAWLDKLRAALVATLEGK